MYGKMQALGLTGFILCTSAVHACQVLSCVQPFVSYGLWPAKLLCSWDFPGKNTWVDCHAHLQGLFLTQGSNPVSCVSCSAGGFFTTEPQRLNPVSYCHASVCSSILCLVTTKGLEITDSCDIFSSWIWQEIVHFTGQYGIGKNCGPQSQQDLIWVIALPLMGIFM